MFCFLSCYVYLLGYDNSKQQRKHSTAIFVAAQDDHSLQESIQQFIKSFLDTFYCRCVYMCEWGVLHTSVSHMSAASRAMKGSVVGSYIYVMSRGEDGSCKFSLVL